jgi:hypothetical protein
MAIVLIELDPQHSGMTRAPIEDDAGMFAPRLPAGFFVRRSEWL